MAEKRRRRERYDVIVAGGGMSGLCAALASARHGARTCLVQNRPVLGGNASSEVRMHICGALGLGHNRANARETGILEELLLENMARNPQASFSVWDTILWEKARFQEGLDLLLNTHVSSVQASRGTLNAVQAEQLSTESLFDLEASVLVDATGDATVAWLAGAEVMKGREAASTYGERYAPPAADDCTMGSTILFETVDMGRPVPFVKPWWADSFTEEDLKNREHEEVSSGYWWIELGGHDLDTIADGERIRDELLKAVYGIWDHIKNGGGHGAENLALSWVGFLPGKRESRRVRGRSVLVESDLLSGRVFDDAVAYGGWPIDLHVASGLRNRQEPTTFIHLDGVYTIPYGSLLPQGCQNLIVAGRAISTSHVAFGSTRVMGTCAVVGQAAGTAAALAVAAGAPPAELCSEVRRLQRALQRDDCHLPGFVNGDSEDLARGSAPSASSSMPGSPAGAVIDGHGRSGGGLSHCWVSDPRSPLPAWIRLELGAIRELREVDFRFDSDLSRELMLSLSHRVRRLHYRGIPPVLVRDYELELELRGTTVYRESVAGNHLRHRVHLLPRVVAADAVKLTVRATHGDASARVFEIRLYPSPR